MLYTVAYTVMLIAYFSVSEFLASIPEQKSGKPAWKNRAKI